MSVHTRRSVVNETSPGRESSTRLTYIRPTSVGKQTENGAMANDFPRFDLNGEVALVTGAARGLGPRFRWLLLIRGPGPIRILRPCLTDSRPEGPESQSRRSHRQSRSYRQRSPSETMRQCEPHCLARKRGNFHFELRTTGHPAGGCMDVSIPWPFIVHAL